MPRKIIVFITITLILTLVACSTTTSETVGKDPISVMDALERNVELPALPERIVVGGNGALMIVDAILAFPEGQERLVAYTKTDQGKGSFTEIILGENTAELIEDRTSVEAIAAYQPDIVLLKSYMRELGNTLEEVGIPVAYFNFETYQQYQQDMTNLGLLLGNPARAEELSAYYNNIVDEIEATTEELADSQKPTVLFAYYDTRDNAVALKVPPMEWAQTAMIERAGGIPVWSDIQLSSSWTIVSFEQIAAWNPDVIFLTSYFENVDDVKLALLTDPQWQQLKAVTSNQLYAFPMAFYSWDQPHTRWGIVQQWLTNKLHPDKFTEFNFQDEAESFYKLFYGWEDNQYQTFIEPILQGDIIPSP